ncbi:helix-turn-helix domain-containing protein [Aminobacter carboxidus]|uniref:Helix-turn-helix domain-containing protein n=1 Tax=Aminobacter carboxidus TaxID=376165 RepID=A0ABR9GIG4_9HYPH|nr:helix-turn-helix domain-containing protein [Aminobacter carboxidus]MBE1203415.1 helix-turn-helix domain-containing protein [Aminobacter carboxidus]
MALTQGRKEDIHVLCDTLGQSPLAAYFHEAQISERERHTPRSIHRARRYLEENFAKELTVTHGRQLLLHSDLPVMEIAERCGYKNPYHFSRQIRLHFGRSPTELRLREGYGISTVENAREA